MMNLPFNVYTSFNQKVEGQTGNSCMTGTKLQKEKKKKQSSTYPNIDTENISKIILVLLSLSHQFH